MMRKVIDQGATILLLVGTSSAGKSTLAKALQATLPEHYLLLGLDDVFRMVSPRWGGGMAGPLSYHGFRYDTDPARAITTIRYGQVGRAILEGMHEAVAAFARAGTHVIVDEMLLDSRILGSWARALAPFHTYLIKVVASLATLEEREARRGNPVGLARGHYQVNDLPNFDWMIDTTSTAPHQAASELISWMEANPLPKALQQYAS